MPAASRPPFDERAPTDAEQGARRASAASGASEERQAASPLDGVEAQFSEFVAYAAHYFTAQRDLAGWRIRNFMLRAAALLGLGAAIVAGLVTAAVFVLRGVAHGIGAALGERMWAGELVTGAAIFLMLGAMQRIIQGQMRRSWQERFAAKYEQYQQRQRAAFGHDAKQTADERRSG